MSYAEAIFDHSKYLSDLYLSDSVFTKYNDIRSKSNRRQHVLDEVTRRINTIGAIPRFVLADDDLYEEGVDAIRNSASLLFEDIKYLSVYNVTENCKYYIAPYIKNLSSK
jgi:hypothetical protein